MPKELSDATAITMRLGWLVAIVGLLMGLASSSGVLVYQVSELRAEVKSLTAQQQASERAILETVTTLKIKKVIE
jgi:hypothetical protein